MIQIFRLPSYRLNKRIEHAKTNEVSETIYPVLEVALTQGTQSCQRGIVSGNGAKVTKPV